MSVVSSVARVPMPRPLGTAVGARGGGGGGMCAVELLVLVLLPGRRLSQRLRSIASCRSSSSLSCCWCSEREGAEGRAGGACLYPFIWRGGEGERGGGGGDGRRGERGEGRRKCMNVCTCTYTCKHYKCTCYVQVGMYVRMLYTTSGSICVCVAAVSGVSLLFSPMA